MLKYCFTDKITAFFEIGYKSTVLKKLISFAKFFFIKFRKFEDIIWQNGCKNSRKLKVIRFQYKFQSLSHWLQSGSIHFCGFSWLENTLLTMKFYLSMCSIHFKLTLCYVQLGITQILSKQCQWLILEQSEWVFIWFECALPSHSFFFPSQSLFFSQWYIIKIFELNN